MFETITQMQFDLRPGALLFKAGCNEQVYSPKQGRRWGGARGAFYF